MSISSGKHVGAIYTAAFILYIVNSRNTEVVAGPEFINLFRAQFHPTGARTFFFGSALVFCHLSDEIGRPVRLYSIPQKPFLNESESLD